VDTLFYTQISKSKYGIGPRHIAYVSVNWRYTLIHQHTTDTEYSDQWAMQLSRLGED